VEKAEKYLIWKTEGKVAKLLTMTFAYHSSCRLFDGDDPSQCLSSQSSSAVLSSSCVNLFSILSSLPMLFCSADTSQRVQRSETQHCKKWLAIFPFGK
jgi:hypothetical protein